MTCFFGAHESPRSHNKYCRPSPMSAHGGQETQQRLRGLMSTRKHAGARGYLFPNRPRHTPAELVSEQRCPVTSAPQSRHPQTVPQEDIPDSLNGQRHARGRGHGARGRLLVRLPRRAGTLAAPAVYISRGRAHGALLELRAKGGFMLAVVKLRPAPAGGPGPHLSVMLPLLRRPSPLPHLDI